MKHYEQLLGNPNVSTFKLKNQLHVSIVSFDFNTSVDKHKTEDLFNMVVQCKNEIADHLAVQEFVCSVANYTIDGCPEMVSTKLTPEMPLKARYA